MRVRARGPFATGRSRSVRAGFTLVELLVVLGIIMILVSLLLPSLAGARAAARGTACLSNQRQILLALAGYLNQYKDVVPREGSVDHRPGHERDYLSWAVALRPLLDEKVSAAEDPNDLFEHAPYYRDPGRPMDGHRIHFVANGVPYLEPGVIDPAPEALGQYQYRRGPTPLARLRFPEETAYIGEYADAPADGSVAIVEAQEPTDIHRAQLYDIWKAESIVAGPNQRLATKRHGSGGNLAYMDGHAKSVPARVISDINTWDDRDYGTRRGGN